MATAIDFPERNDFIGKPETMSNNQVYALPVCRFLTRIPGVIERAAPVECLAHVSCWKLTDEEIKNIVETGVVFLRILGQTLPPLSIEGLPPININVDLILTEEQIKILKGQL